METEHITNTNTEEEENKSVSTKKFQKNFEVLVEHLKKSEMFFQTSP